MKIFLSAVSGQFKACRDALASDLRAIGCEVRVQEDFQQGPHTLIERLEEYVDQCDRIIALVGDAYGADAKAAGLLDAKPPRSYTQWEYYFAIGERLRTGKAAVKELYVYGASPAYLSAHPVNEPEEHTQRQQAFIELVKASGKHRASFDTLDQLCRLVLRDGWQMHKRPSKPKPPFELPKRALAGQLYGRAQALEDLTQRLQRRESVDVWGPAGMGKTALAAEAIYRCIGDSDSALATSPYPDGMVLLDLYKLKGGAEEAWHYLANAFDPDVSTAQAAQQRARTACRARRALVVVEGAEQYGDGAALQQLLSVLAAETVRLVLTRSKQQLSHARPISLERDLASDEALALLRACADGAASESLLNEIHAILGGHPLALTWAGRRLSVRDEAPSQFVRDLKAAQLPDLHQPGDEHHTLHWLYARSTARLDPAAKRLLAAAGALAHSAFPLSAARTALADDATEAAARSALRPLVHHGLLRLSDVEQEWQFTHALAYQFARATGQAAPLAALGTWASTHIEAGVAAFRDNAGPLALENALRHAAALLRADTGATELEMLADALRYKLHDAIAVLGRLDLVRAALLPMYDWLLAAPAPRRNGDTWQRKISVSCIRLGDVNVAAGQLDNAREAFQQSLSIAEHLAKADPGNGQWQRDLSVSYERLGDVHVASGQLDNARKAFEHGLSIAEHLAKADPSNGEWQRDLSISYVKLGDVHMAVGQLDNARKAFEQSLSIAERLARADASNSQRQRDLSISYERLGDVHVAADQLHSAREAFEQGLSIAERLAKADPGNSQWQRDLSVSYERLGDVHVASGQFDSARKAFEHGLSIAEHLAKADPSNSEWQRDLSISYVKLGDVHMAVRQLDSARKSFERGLNIAERLAKANPSYGQWQRDLSESCVKLGDVHLAAGQFEEARNAFEQSLAIFEQMSNADPANSEWQRDLCVSYTKFAEVDERAGDKRKALEWAEKASTIRERLAKLDPLNATWQKDVQVSREMVKRLSGK